MHSLRNLFFLNARSVVTAQTVIAQKLNKSETFALKCFKTENVLKEVQNIILSHPQSQTHAYMQTHSNNVKYLNYAILCGISLGPLSSDAIMLLPVASILLSNAAHKRIMRVAVSQQRTDGQQHFGYGQCWTPIVFQNIQANHTLTVNVAVINTCSEHNLSAAEG